MELRRILGDLHEGRHRQPAIYRCPQWRVKLSRVRGLLYGDAPDTKDFRVVRVHAGDTLAYLLLYHFQQSDQLDLKMHHSE
jgi:hypothetical protein